MKGEAQVRKRYRYIAAYVSPDEEVCDFRLLAGNKLRQLDFLPTTIRITIPADMQLDQCDGWSSTESTCLIKDMDPVVMILKDSKYIIDNALTHLWLSHKLEACQFFDTLRERYSYKMHVGFIDNDKK